MASKARKTKAKPLPVTRRFLDALTGAKEDAFRRVLDALSLARRDTLSATKAAKASGTTLKTMRKYASSALEERSGRAYVKATDRLPRRMRMFTNQGEVVVRTRSSRTATRIAEHNNAVREYVLTRDTSKLQQFDGKSVRSDGIAYSFGTDPRLLDRHIRAAAVHFVDIYARAAAV